MQTAETHVPNGTNGINGKKPAQELALVQNIELTAIDESPTNPRKTFADVEDLAADVKVHGVLQPVLVRPSPKGKRYELVFGARRFRAAKLAKLSTIPAMVRDIDDATALEIQIVENSKRADIHPLEEADGYKALHDKHGYSVEEIAAKVGKSAATIYGRLKFCTLVPEARKAFLDGKLTAATALLVARIPHADLQKEALKALTEKRYDGELPSVREAARIIEEDFMMTLGQAPFDVKDASLIAGVPSCSACPKRTGNQRELFADASSKDLCTDPKCFKTKVDASWTKRSEEHKKKSLPILEGKKAEEALSYSSPYVDLDKKNYDDRQERTYRELLAKKKADVPVVLARDGEGGAHELVFQKDLVKIGLVAKASATSSVSQSAKKQRAAEAKRKEQVRTVVEKMISLAGPVRAAKHELAFARAFARGCTRLVWHDTAKMICSRRGIEIPTSSGPREALAKLANTLDVAQLRGLVVEIVCSDETTRKEFVALFKVKA